MSAGGRPQAAASVARAAASASSRPDVCRSTKRTVGRAASARPASRTLNSATSLPGFSAEMKIGDVAGLGAARIDDHDLHRRSRALGRFQPLEQHGMAPGEIAADQHHEIGLLEILVAAGHRVAAEGALVARHRRGHAEARIGVDVGGAEEAFDQLVGGVIVLGQQLAGDIEGDGIGPVFVSIVFRKPSATVSSATSHETRWPSISGCSRRSSSDSVSPSAAPFGAQPPMIGGMTPVALDARRRPCRRASRPTPHPDTPQ